MVDAWLEVADAVRENKLRAALTALSVAWGLFMLVILLGAGRGLQNQTEHQFRDDAVNSLWVGAGTTRTAFEGRPAGRRIRLDNGDFDAVASLLPAGERSTARFNLRGVSAVALGGEVGSFDIRATHPAHRYLERTKVVVGRFINDLDMGQHRKVAVVGTDVADILFPQHEEDSEAIVGEEIAIGGVVYRVVGVFTDEGSEGELSKVYLPITTAQRAHGGANRVDRIIATVPPGDVAGSRRIEHRVRARIARRHRFAPQDAGAVRVRNNLEDYSRVTGVFRAIDLFVWLVGLGTVLSGVVGVSNIMMISVAERTREFGVRKALGATPRQIVGLVLKEAVLLTSCSGYLGLLAGVGLLSAVRAWVPENDYLRQPEVGPTAIGFAFALVVGSGVVAGLIPAIRAAKLKPIVALREE